MATWAPNVSKHMPYQANPPKSRNGKAVIGVIPHIGANRPGQTVAGYVSNYNDRNSHPTYVIKTDGTVIGVVHPDQRPTSTTNGIDESAVTVEMDNTVYGGDWDVSEAQLQALAIIIRHHADESPRRGKPIVKNDPKNTQSGFFVGWHSQYRNVTCPGKFVLDNLQRVIDIANGATSPAAPAAPAAPSAPGKSINQLAKEVIAGNWGSGDDRRKRLGTNYAAVQKEVNRILKGGGAHAAPAPSAPAQGGRREMRNGTRGADVGNLQRFLKSNYSLYASHVVVDDHFGDQMEKVVKEFQQRSGITPDGVVGLKETWPALQRAGFNG